MNNKTFIILFLSFIIIIHLLCGLQYFNFCDEMFVVTSGQFFFFHPDNISYIFPYYLGGLVAGIWNFFFDWLGFYGFRILNTIVVATNFYIVYLLLIKCFNRWYIFAGVFLTILAETSDLNMAIHHNSLTCLLTTCAAFFLYKGLTENNRNMFYLSGIVLGINVFTRIPNMALVGLIFSLIPYYMYNQEKTKQIFFFLLFSIFGFITGITIVLGIMAVIGHLPLFLESINLLFSFAKDSDSGHGIIALIPVYIQDYSIITIISSYILLSLFLLTYIEKNTSFTSTRFIPFLLSVVFVTIPFVILYYTQPTFKIWHYYYAIVTMVFVYIITQYKQNQHLVYLSTISFIIIYLQPLGGDFGIGNMHSCALRLALPFSIGVIGIIINDHKRRLFFRYYSWFYILLLMIWGLNIMIKHKAWYDSDPTPRWMVKTMPKSQRLNVFLPQNEAELIDDVVEELMKYKGKYQSLQTNDMPVFNYITGMKPYLQSTTSDFYSPPMLKEQYIKAEKKYGRDLPILIMSMKTGSNMYHYDENWNNINCMSSRLKGRFMAHQEFIKRHHYKEVWRKESFSILLPDMY